MVAMKFLLACLLTCLASNLSLAAYENQFGKVAKFHGVRVKSAAKKVTLQNPVQLMTINQVADFGIKLLTDVITKFNLDPYFPPNQTQTINPVTLELSNMTIYNLSTITRVSDVEILDSEIDRKTAIGVTLKFTDVKLISNYKANVRVLRLTAGSMKGVLTAFVPAILVKASLILDLKSLNATLDGLDLTMDKSRLKVDLSGGSASQIANIAMPAITTILQRIILDVIGNPLRSNINKFIALLVNDAHRNLALLG